MGHRNLIFHKVRKVVSSWFFVMIILNWIYWCMQLSSLNNNFIIFSIQHQKGWISLILLFMAFLTGFLDMFYIAWATVEANVINSFDPKVIATRLFEGARTVAVGQRNTIFDYFLIRHFLRWTGGHKIRVNFPFKIYPEKLLLKRINGSGLFEAPIPNSYIGVKDLTLKLFSKYKRKGQLATCTMWTHQIQNLLGLNCPCEIKEPSKSIIFHAHGGGFTSLPSRSHETYLKSWVDTTETPILSVNYSLAPECPYPRACEELLYAYCWMRNNFEKLGTTGENVIFAGDSAGGNLMTSLTINCIRLQIPLPNSVALFYPVLLVQNFPSPSRYLSMFGPITTFPFWLKCISSYRDSQYTKKGPKTYEEEVESSMKSSKNDVLLSPVLATKEILAQFPKTYIFGSDIDPILDDYIEFSKKLVEAKAPVSLYVLDGMPHGYLNLLSNKRICRKWGSAAYLSWDFISIKLKELLT